jgi:hypothetical protein
MARKTTAQILADAADVIDRNGWIQNSMYDVDSKRVGKAPARCAVCLMGAINIAAFGLPSEMLVPYDVQESVRPAQLARVAAVEHLADLQAGAVGFPALSDWNDAPGRTRDQVTAFLRAAAAKARA